MRTSILWRVFLPVVAAAVFLPVYAQIRPDGPVPIRPRILIGPNDAQKALLDQIQGVGPIKFGATVESFGKDTLTPFEYPGDTPTTRVHYYKYLKANEITWGTLHPSTVELEFSYNQLVIIRLKFQETLGSLLVVKDAVSEKYGPAKSSGQIRLSDGSSYSGPAWISDRMQLIAMFPEKPAELESNDLKVSAMAAVQLEDFGLWRKQSEEKLEAAQAEMLKGHDLEKIKADL